MAQGVFQTIITGDMLKKREQEVAKQKFVEFEEMPDIGQDEKFKLFPFQARVITWALFFFSFDKYSFKDYRGYTASGFRSDLV
jgi:hypothetical protein